MTEFKDWFHLKERESFTIDPKMNKNDAKFYFGRKEIDARLKSQIRRSFVEPGIPKMFIYGSYGSGKTQTLFHLDYYLKNDKKEHSKFIVKPIHLDIELGPKSSNKDIHLQLMEALGKSTVVEWVDKVMSHSANSDSINEDLKKVFQNENFTEVAKSLRIGGDIGLLAWRWFCGNSLKNNELQQLKATRALGDLGAGDMVNALVGIGKLAERNGYRIVFLIDEMEQLTNVKTAENQEAIHNYIRKLAESSNSSVGFIIAYYISDPDNQIEILTRQDVKTRIGDHNYIEIPTLNRVESVETFLNELLKELIKHDEIMTGTDEDIKKYQDTFPFTPSSFEKLCDYSVQDPAKSLPRLIIKAVNECAISAWDEKKKIIDDQIVDEICPLIFG
jgi:hypothetical protein